VGGQDRPAQRLRVVFQEDAEHPCRPAAQALLPHLDALGWRPSNWWHIRSDRKDTMTESMLLTIASSPRAVFICRRLFRERPRCSWLALRIVGQEAHPPGLIGERDLRPHNDE
jgi:hypothetical protein